MLFETLGMRTKYQIKVNSHLWSLFHGTKRPQTSLNDAVNRLIAERVAEYYRDEEQIRMLFGDHDDIEELIDVWQHLSEEGIGDTLADLDAEQDSD